ncbi:ATP-binding protein [Alicyclobacillus sp.]|uniref:ATP-binding protein n=1 Tax=Alicyclobacillus sp. TaxID=61169 RepID=UPI0025B96014|nr:ATP-binding protein [Alicyclobacillus sp.]MCL6517824.1 PAS domain-containing protein [Alicyclobacillus sp.]
MPWPLAAAAGVFACFTVLVTAVLTAAMASNYRQIQETVRVLTNLDRTQTALGEEHGALGVYAWSGDATALAQLRQAHRTFTLASGALMDAARVDPVISASAARVVQEGQAWHQRFAAIAADTGARPNPAHDVDSEQAFAAFRSACQSVRAEVESKLQSQQEQWWHRVWWTFIGFAIAVCGLGAGLAFSILRELRIRDGVEDVLRRTYRNMAQAQRVAGIGSWTWDLEHNRHTWSDETLRIYGLSPQAFSGTDEAFLERVHPEDRDRVRDLMRTLRRRGRGDGEIRVIRPDGAERTLWWRAEVVSDSAGLPTHVVGTVQDITDRKRTEDLLLKSEKLATIGELAVSIAHEIRNPLTALKGFLQLLPNTPPAAHEQYVGIMLDELTRIEGILNELLLLARPQESEYGPVAMADVIRRSLALLEAQALSRAVRVFTHLAPDLPAVWGHAYRIEQALLNVFKNGMEAMPNGGRLTIRGWARSGHVWVACTDEGVGMERDRIAKLGEPLYSTKEKGTGLGLVVTYKVVEMHRGHIEIDSTPGRGTTVTIGFPVRLEAGMPDDSAS